MRRVRTDTINVGSGVYHARVTRFAGVTHICGHFGFHFLRKQTTLAANVRSSERQHQLQLQVKSSIGKLSTDAGLAERCCTRQPAATVVKYRLSSRLSTKRFCGCSEVL